MKTLCLGNVLVGPRDEADCCPLPASDMAAAGRPRFIVAAAGRLMMGLPSHVRFVANGRPGAAGLFIADI